MVMLVGSWIYLNFTVIDYSITRKIFLKYALSFQIIVTLPLLSYIGYSIKNKNIPFYD